MASHFQLPRVPGGVGALRPLCSLRDPGRPAGNLLWGLPLPGSVEVLGGQGAGVPRAARGGHGVRTWTAAPRRQHRLPLSGFLGQ